MRSRELTSQTDRKRILVTTAQWESALACVQSYGRRGHDVFLLDHDPRQPNARSKYCRASSAAHLKATVSASENLIAVLRDGAYDLLVPISDAVVDTIAGHVEEIRRHVRVDLAPAERVLSGQNKAKLARFAPKHGIRIPEVVLPGRFEPGTLAGGPHRLSLRRKTAHGHRQHGRAGRAECGYPGGVFRAAGRTGQLAICTRVRGRRSVLT